MSLYWAESNGGGFFVVNPSYGDRFFFCHTSKMLASNAAKEDWDFLNEGSGGKLYKFFKLTPCPDGTPLSIENGEVFDGEMH